jgi:hypothetical protein
MKNKSFIAKSMTFFDERTDFLKSDKIGSMNFVAKLLLSVVLGIIGFLSLGLWVFIPIVGTIVSIGLCISAVLGIQKIWQPKKVEGEGEIFKYSDRLNKEL